MASNGVTAPMRWGVLDATNADVGEGKACILNRSQRPTAYSAPVLASVPALFQAFSSVVDACVQRAIGHIEDTPCPAWFPSAKPTQRTPSFFIPCIAPQLSQLHPLRPRPVRYKTAASPMFTVLGLLLYPDYPTATCVVALFVALAACFSAFAPVATRAAPVQPQFRVPAVALPA
ncbi:hypothetical protein K505DRAFT_357508 [Melanomma pulvis-pyrius CBS 109.77]|uniref:Uncharacterized protein n=1 Tax=Melanomma pulvis-pyrius CBS 109.77 TaxID=1314802 RepID=A0A6A6XQI7_9PLEO|nr:hypothetical protein K505DRAFT_357508 [Melanomma pulvis-pyrius CBS 109.77]